MRSVEAQFDVKQMVEALAQKPGSDQKYDGDGKFHDNEICPHALPEAPCGRATAVAKPFSDVLEREPQNGSQRHEPRGKQSNGTCKEGHVQIEANVSQKWDVVGHGFRDQ